MSAPDAAPLPRQGEVFFDVRGDSRTMRLSWYADTGVAVFSIWQGGTCTGTFRLPLNELSRMVDVLSRGPGGGAMDPGPPTMAAPPLADDGYSYDRRGGLAGQQPGEYATSAEYAASPEYAPPSEYAAPAGYAAPAEYPAAAEYPASAEYEGPGGYREPDRYQEQEPGRFQEPDGYPEPGAYQAPGGYQEPARYADEDYGGYRDSPPDGTGSQIPPTGPLAVGRWHAEQGQHASGAGQHASGTGQHASGTGQYPPGPGQYVPPGQVQFPPAGPGSLEEYPGEQGYPGQQDYPADYAVDEPESDPLSDGYGAEQGYLPGPMTDTFGALNGGYGLETVGRGYGGEAAAPRRGYEPGPPDGSFPDRREPSPDPAYRDDEGPEPFVYHPAHEEPLEREYRPSRGRS